MVWILGSGIAVFVLLFGVTFWSSLRRVSEDEVSILVVFGEEREILHDDLYFVPPFVSDIYPVDQRTMQYETPQGSKSIPSDLREDVKRTETEWAASN